MVSTCRKLISTFLDDNWYWNRATGINSETIFLKVWLILWVRTPLIYSLEDFLSTEQVEAIKEDGTRYSNLYNRVLNPKSRRKVARIQLSSEIRSKLTIFLAKISLCSTTGAWIWLVRMAQTNRQCSIIQAFGPDLHRIFLFR